MTSANPDGVIRAIRGAVMASGITPGEIDLINGHLTATIFDPREVENWRRALELQHEDFPLINSTKSMIGHSLGAAGGMECIASLLQVHKGFVHPSINCEDRHPELEWLGERVPTQAREQDLRIVAKSSFGFGDVNAVVIFKKWEEA